MAFDPAHPAAQATTLVDQVGNEVLHVAEGIAPIAVPFVLAMVSIRWVLAKFGFRPSGSGSVINGVAFDSDWDYPDPEDRWEDESDEYDSTYGHVATTPSGRARIAPHSSFDPWA